MLKELKTKTTITLGETVNALDIQPLQDAFNKALAREKPLEVQCKQVSSIDTLSCQLIMSAQQTFEKKQLQFDIIGESENFDRAFARLGLNKTESNEEES